MSNWLAKDSPCPHGSCAINMGVITVVALVPFPHYSHLRPGGSGSSWWCCRESAGPGASKCIDPWLSDIHECVSVGLPWLLWSFCHSWSVNNPAYGNYMVVAVVYSVWVRITLDRFFPAFIPDRYMSNIIRGIYLRLEHSCGEMEWFRCDTHVYCINSSNSWHYPCQFHDLSSVCISRWRFVSAGVFAKQIKSESRSCVWKLQNVHC